MDLFFAFLYAGGVFAMPERKIGVLDRIFWIAEIGEYMHKMIIEASK